VRPPTAEVATTVLQRTLPNAAVDVAQERSPKARHGRRETRTLWTLDSAALNAYVGSAGRVGTPWPGVAQVLRLQRTVQVTPAATTTTGSGTSHVRTRTEVAYAVTSLPSERATAADLLLRWRAHWHIENRLHWVRDVTLGEDASAIHLGQAPLVVALLRTAVLALLRHTGAASLAVAQRDLALHPAGFLALFTDLARRLTAAPASRPSSARLRLLPQPHRPLRRPARAS